MQNPKTNPKARERPMCPTQTFSNSGRWLWMSVTGWCGLVLPIKHLLSWVRYLHNHRVTWTPIDCHCWGLKWKIKRVFKKRLEKFHLGWTGGLLALLPESGHHGRTRQRPELFEHRHNSGRGDHLWSFGNFVTLGDFYYLGWLHRTASWRGVFPHRSSTSSSTCQLN